MRYFKKNMEKYGVKYATLMKLWGTLDNIDNMLISKGYSLRLIAKLQDKIEIVLDKYDKHLQPPEEPIEFESNCINWQSCDNCHNKGLCNAY